MKVVCNFQCVWPCLSLPSLLPLSLVSASLVPCYKLHRQTIKEQGSCFHWRIKIPSDLSEKNGRAFIRIIEKKLKGLRNERRVILTCFAQECNPKDIQLTIKHNEMLHMQRETRTSAHRQEERKNRTHILLGILCGRSLSSIQRGSTSVVASYPENFSRKYIIRK